MQAERLPDSTSALVLRTDFSDDEAWRSICAAIEAPRGDFRAYVEFVSDHRFDQATVDQLLELHKRSNYRSYFFVVDHTTLTDPDRPILVVDLLIEPGRTFRVIPSEMWSVENNLSLANLDFADFVESADNDGIFRGFPEV
jgi:hypothetical protein